MYCVVSIILLLSGCLCDVTPHAPVKWDYDVYTGRHFNTLVTSTTANDDVIASPAILVMYGPECHTEARAIRDSLRPWGAMNQYLTLTFHDYVTYARHIWYDLDYTDDLKQRYILPEDDCLKVLFFEEGSRLAGPEVWNKHVAIYEWVWSKFGLNILISNALNETIVVYTAGQGSPSIIDTIKKEGTSNVNVQLGMALTVHDKNNTMLYAVWIPQQHRFERLEITKELVDDFQNNLQNNGSLTWVSRKRAELQEESDKVHSDQWSIAEMYLLSFKLPMILPTFTEKGYLKTTIPADVYSTLKTFYDTGKATRGAVSEQLPGVAINTKSVMTGLVELTEDIKQFVYKALLNQMQEWCQCELEQTAFYGIREYYKGNMLRMHLDRVETHVIASILQIDQDLGQSSDWNLEIIDFNGKRQNVTLHPGEMLLYESATLIHGRPSTFNGNLFANCFIHYKPVSNWNWKAVVIETRPAITNNDVVMEYVDTINSFNGVHKNNVKVEL